MLLRRYGCGGRGAGCRRLVQLGDELIGQLQDLRSAADQDAISRGVGNRFDARRRREELSKLLAGRFGIGLVEHVGFELSAVVGLLRVGWDRDQQRPRASRSRVTGSRYGPQSFAFDSGTVA